MSQTMKIDVMFVRNHIYHYLTSKEQYKNSKPEDFARSIYIDRCQIYRRLMVELLRTNKGEFIKWFRHEYKSYHVKPYEDEDEEEDFDPSQIVSDSDGIYTVLTKHGYVFIRQ